MSRPARGLSTTTNDAASAYLPAVAQSTRVAELPQAVQHHSGQPDRDQALVVFACFGRLTSTDLAGAAVEPRPGQPIGGTVCRRPTPA